MRALTACLALLVTLSPAAASGLEIIVLPTIQYAHEDIWSKTPNGRGPASTAVGQVLREQPVHILVFAMHCAIDDRQTAEVNYQVSFRRPDGTNGESQSGLKLIPRGRVDDPQFIRKAAMMVGFVATKDDPLGTWGVIVDATDQVSGSTVRREQSFEVVGDEVLRKPLSSVAEHAGWLMNYHRKPAPQQLLTAIRLTAESPPVGAKPRRDAENGAWLGFFEQVLTDNPWLLPHLVSRLGEATGRERELLATLLAYAKRDDLSFFQTLPPAARDAFMLRRKENWPVPVKDPLSGTQLDVLWGRFFASGRYAPIRELVAILAYHPYKDVLDDYKKLEKKPAEPPPELRQSAVFRALVWSLRSNIQQDKVVRDYCEGILLRKELPEAEHRWLGVVFQAAVDNLRKPPPPDPAASNAK